MVAIAELVVLEDALMSEDALVCVCICRLGGKIGVLKRGHSQLARGFKSKHSSSDGSAGNNASVDSLLPSTCLASLEDASDVASEDTVRTEATVTIVWAPIIFDACTIRSVTVDISPLDRRIRVMIQEYLFLIPS